MYACKNEINTSRVIKIQIKKKQPKNNTKETPLKSKQKVINNLIKI